jgi:hypothetical protein
MLHSKKFTVVAIITVVTAIGISAMRPSDDKPPKRNLKVLPKDISHDDLDKTMDAFKAALGVKCNFCHAPYADTSNHHLDFASDAKPEKNIARHMYKMVGRINKKFFGMNKDANGNLVQTVTCVTCHHGSPHPDAAK